MARWHCVNSCGTDREFAWHTHFIAAAIQSLAMMGVDTLRNVKSKLCDSSFSLDKTFFSFPKQMLQKHVYSFIDILCKTTIWMWPRYELADYFCKNYGTKTQADWPSRHCIQSLLTVLACMWRLVRCTTWQHGLNPLESTRVNECLKLHLHKCKAMLGLSFEKPEALGFFSFTFEILGMKFDPFN